MTDLYTGSSGEGVDFGSQGLRDVSEGFVIPEGRLQGRWCEAVVTVPYVPDLQVQDQEAAVGDVLEGSGQVSQGLEDLLPAASALTAHLAV